MRRIYRATDKKVYVGCLFKKKSAYKRRAVAFHTPLRVAFVIFKIILCIRQNLVYRYNSLGDQINAVDICNRRNVGLLEFEACPKRLA